MSPQPPRLPTEQDARAIVAAVLGQEAREVRRFTTGLCHFVYEATLGDGASVVVRVAHPGNEALLAGAARWSALLRPRGVPLPALLHADLDATLSPFASLVLERLPGTDLGHVYAQMTSSERRALALQVAQVQAQVHTLPPGNGFGYALAPDEALLHRRWTEVVEASLARSAARIAAVGIVDARHVERVQAWLPHFAPYLDDQPPTAFLDDTTTKNVLVHEGRLSGIVDVDFVCYGDSLWTIGLTQMALLNLGQSTEYVTSWMDFLNLAAAQRRVVGFYTAIFCVDFLSELGQPFNRAEAAAVAQADVERLTRLLDTLLAAL